MKTRNPTIRAKFLATLGIVCAYVAYGNAAVRGTCFASIFEDPGTTRYQHDALGNLRTVNLPDGTKIEYLTDSLNRRIGRKVNGKLVQGFLWQSRLRPVAELDGKGKVVSQFVYATGINVPAYMKRAGKTYRLITDDLGSVRLVVDVSTGEIAQRLDYDEFGNVLRDTEPGFQPFGFAGGLYDPRTKLVRFGARDYDPTTGRWMTKDPIRFAAGETNAYAYAGNDPLNLVDPEGLQPRQDNPPPPPPPAWRRPIDRLGNRYNRGWTFYDWYASCATQPGDTYRRRLSGGGLGNSDRLGGFGQTDIRFGNQTDRWTDAWTARNPGIQESPSTPVITIRYEWWERGRK